MVAITMTYQGELRCEAVHGPSGTCITTDAPKDNHGRGEAFSPTDLMATALGTCILTTMGIVARGLNVDMAGASASVEKIMATTPPRRIASLPVTVTMPAGIDPQHHEKLEHAARHCPVHQSLHAEIDRPMMFVWG